MKMAERALTNVPQGYSSAVEKVNSIPQDLLAELCQDVTAFLQYKVSLIPVDHHQKRFQEAGVNCDAKLISNAISYIFRSAAKAKLTADKLVEELSSSMLWNESALSVIKHIWNDQGKFLCSPDLAQSINIGQLVDMKWKLSVGMSSSSCRSLNASYVTVLATVADPSGQLKTQSFEMTIAEFKKFSSQVREISSVLETV